MSSGFISEAELEEQRRVRQEQWDKVRKPEEPEACPEVEYDHRSLFERLEEQKNKREMEYEEAHKLKNMIKGLDDDEVEFLDLVDRSKMEEERRKSAEEAREINDFRNAVATLQERHLEDRINSEIRTRPAQSTNGSGRSSQVRLLAGAVRKRPVESSVEHSGGGLQKKTKLSSEMNGVVTNGEVRAETETTEADTTTGKVQPSESDSRGGRPAEDDDGGLRCIGILPGLGVYPDTSDSDQSSDTDQDLPESTGLDLLGRKAAEPAPPPKSSSGSDSACSSP
ncbi:PSME3-interacting protein isoform X2 [Bacillus rossius redtenbacheri]|uniref:PSME3-interacting protein isoform X2 n=1 Tax=Bacillus rossius redtenbacheri TaxID=93214 RepID=UPI002FDC9074